MTDAEIFATFFGGDGVAKAAIIAGTLNLSDGSTAEFAVGDSIDDALAVLTEKRGRLEAQEGVPSVIQQWAFPDTSKIVTTAAHQLRDDRPQSLVDRWGIEGDTAFGWARTEPF